MISAATCVNCQRTLAPDDTHGLCGGCLAASLAGVLDGGGGTAGTGGLAGYQLLEELSRGGMGIVYRAQQRGLNRWVALKIVHATAGGADGSAGRLRKEAELAATLEHPNIVPVYDVGEVDGRPWFTMKLAEGGSLAGRLEEFRLPVGAGATEAKARLRKLAELFAATARGVHHAHQHGILHRDLKPSNILLDANDVPLVADFGIAVRSDVDATLTFAGGALGTPAYLAPEVARDGSRSSSVAADVYGLGAVLFHLLTGRTPYVGASAFEVLSRISTAEVPPPATLNPAVPVDWATLCGKCLERDPDRRYASALAVAEECERLLRGEPILARPLAAPELLRRWIRRRPLVAGLLALVVVASGLGVGGVIWQWRQAEFARGQAERSAATARAAEERASAIAYFATLAQALATRQQGDLGHARRLLAGLPPERRGFEWRLLQWLCRGDETRGFELATPAPRCLVWEPVRQRLAVLGEDRVMRWLDPATGAIETGATVPDCLAEHAPEALEKGFHQLTFSPDGRHFLCGDGDLLIIAETDSGRRVHSAASRHMGGVWLDDHRVLYAGNTVWGATGRQPGAVFDLTTGKAEGLAGRVYAPLAISDDREQIAWSRDHPNGVRIEVLPVEQLVPVAAQLRSPRETLLPIASPALLAFDRGQVHLGAALAGQIGQPKFISVFALGNSEPVFSLELGTQIHALAFSPDEPVLAVATDDRALRALRFLQPKPESATYDDDTFPELAQPVPPSGPRLPPMNLLSRSAFGGQIQFLLGHEEAVRDLTFLPGPRGLTTVGGDRTLRQWPLTPTAPNSRVGGVWTLNSWEHPAMSADGRFALYRADTNRTWLWDRQSGRRMPLPEWQYPLAVRRDGGAVTRHFHTGEIVVWAPPGDDGEPPNELWRVQGIPSHPGFGPVVRGVLSRDERTVVGLIPGKLLVVDLESRIATGTRDQRMLHGVSAVNCVDLSPDGRLIAVTGFLGRRARLYQAADVNGGFVSLGDAPDYDTAVAFHPDGRRLFVGNEDGRVRVFDVDTRAELRDENWPAHSGAVTALALTGDGRIVATSGDRTLQFWDALPVPGEPRRERLRMNVPAPRNWMQFAADARVFVHVAPGHPLEAWEAP